MASNGCAAQIAMRPRMVADHVARLFDAPHRRVMRRILWPIMKKVAGTERYERTERSASVQGGEGPSSKVSESFFIAWGQHTLAIPRITMIFCVLRAATRRPG